jgi:hypothetical protein
MANPLYLFRADGRLDERVLHIGRWSVGVVDKIGSNSHSSCVLWAERTHGLSRPRDSAARMDPGCRLFLSRDPLIQKESA